VGLRDGLAAAGLVDHVSQGEAREVLSHVISHVSPYAEQNALALVVARTVLVGLAEISGIDRSVDSRHNLSQGYGFSRPGEDVAATDAALGPYESDALQAEQDLLEVGLGESGSFGEVAHRRG
jgi:hypothetical protein